MKTENIFILIAIVAFLGAFVLFLKYEQEQKVIGNKNILKELNGLLLPVYQENIAEKDFDNLKYSVRDDSIATEQVNELILLTKYGELEQVGQGIAILYDYIKTGKESICPGQALAHYFVFINQGENKEAHYDLKEAQTQIEYYTYYVNNLKENSSSSDIYRISLELFQLTLDKISSGDNSTNSEQIKYLSNAPCVK